MNDAKKEKKGKKITMIYIKLRKHLSKLYDVRTKAQLKAT